MQKIWVQLSWNQSRSCATTSKLGATNNCHSSHFGLMDVGLYRGHVNEVTFLDFVTLDVLAPNLLPFDGVNPRSVVIMGTYRSSRTFRLVLQ